MKKCFTSGLAILLPVILTLFILNFLINFVTKPFIAFTESLLENFISFHQPLLYYYQDTIILIVSKLLILLFLVALTILIGVFGKLFLIDLFFRVGDVLLHKLPYINKIYRACKDIVHSLLSSSSNKFTQVVLVPFPHLDSLSVGLVTNDSLKIENSIHDSEELVSVFVPGTPNPSVGFLLAFKRDDIRLINMKVDEAMKFVVSCGIVLPDFEILHHHQTYEHPFNSKNYLLSSQGQLNQDSADLQKSAGGF